VRGGGFLLFEAGRRSDQIYPGTMAMDSYYTDRFDKYAEDEGTYHVLFSCPKGRAIKEKHRTLGMPPASENRRPCAACVNEIKKWLTGLPGDIRPSGLEESAAQADAADAADEAEETVTPEGEGGGALPE
jgi:hypothetical protein